MKALLIKDFLSMKNNLKSYLYSLVLFFVIGVFTKNFSFITMMISVFALNQTISSFSYDEYSHFPQFGLTMPLGRRDLVRGKYVFGLLSLTISVLLSLIVSYLGFVVPGSVDLGELLATHYGIFLVMGIYLAILLPVAFIKGLEKVRMALGLTFALMGFLGFLAFKVLPRPLVQGFFEGLENNLALALGLSLLALIIVLALSYKITYSRYRNQDL